MVRVAAATIRRTGPVQAGGKLVEIGLPTGTAPGQSAERQWSRFASAGKQTPDRQRW